MSITAAAIAAAGSVLGGALGGKGSKDAAEMMSQPSWFEEAFGDEFSAMGAAFLANLDTMDLQRGEIDFEGAQQGLDAKQAYLTQFATQSQEFFNSQMAAVDPATSAANQAIVDASVSFNEQSLAQNTTSAIGTGNTGSSTAALENAATTAATTQGMNSAIMKNEQAAIKQKSSIYGQASDTASGVYGQANDLMGQQYAINSIIAKDETLRKMNAQNPEMAQLLVATMVLGPLSGI